MNRNYEIALIKNTILDENGREIASYGISYTDKDRTITVRHLSTKRSDVEFFMPYPRQVERGILICLFHNY